MRHYRFDLIPAVLIAGVGLLFALPQDSSRRQPDVPYVPSTDEAVAAMLQLAGVTAADTVYDLGCGDGRIVIAAAKLGAHGVGIDINPARVAEARENVKKAGLENRVKIVEEDLFQTDIHEATVVTLFLLTSVNEKLKPKLLSDLKPGTRVVSNTFSMGDWTPDKTITVPGADPAAFLSRTIYLFTVPAR